MAKRANLFLAVVMIFSSVIFISTALFAQGRKIDTRPSKAEVISRIQELQNSPTTEDNLQQRASQIKKLLRLLEQRKGKEQVESIVSIQRRMEFTEAMRSGDYSTACQIADEIIENLAEFARSTRGKIKPKRASASDEHIAKFKAKDGQDIYGYLLKPEGKAEFPAIVLVHGGRSSRQATLRLGEGKHAQGFKEAGYVTLAVDYRKSEFGGKEIDDVIAAIEYLTRLSFVDAQRIGLFGSSHGAYMSLMTASRVGRDVEAVVENFAFTDLAVQYNRVVSGETSHSQEDIDRFIKMGEEYFGGSPVKTPEMYNQRSPVYNAGKFKAPILIIHGKNDQSVPVEQAYELEEALKKCNKVYEIKIYENGPHGFIYRNTDEARDAWDKTINFFDKYLKKEEEQKKSDVSLIQEEIIESSPFGFHPACIRERGVLSFEDAQDIGIKWHRTSRYLFWMIVQRDLTRKEYDFSSYDRLMQELPSDMSVLMNIAAVPAILVAPPPGNRRVRFSLRQQRDKQRARQYVVEGSYLPADIDAYSDFVKKAVERYDGDGIEDMPGLKNPIKVWQVDNEPPRRLKDYAKLLKITYSAIKEADPEAKVMIGGATGSPKGDGGQYISKFNKEFLPILRELDGKYIDIFDFHWYGNASGDYKKCRKIYNFIRERLSQAGFSKDLPIWITEMGTYSGRPLLGNFAYQSEKQQAIDVVKRYVYPLSLGIKKIFLAFGLMEGFRDDDNYFEHTGLIYNGRFSNDLGRGVKKLAYYTYKKMVEVLEGSDWNNIQTIQEKDGIYIYKFTKDGRPIWVAWNDNKEPRRVTITLDKDAKDIKITEAVPKYDTGREVKDYNTGFREIRGNILESYPLQLAFELKGESVFIKPELPLAQSQRLIDLSVDWQQLKQHFNQNKSNVRMVLILSPVCLMCQKGAYVIQQKILDRITDRRLKIFVVWTRVKKDDNRKQALESMKIINDERVIHYWDSEKKLGFSYGRILDLPRNRKLAWDVFFVFDDKAEWIKEPPVPDYWMHQLGPDKGDNRRLNGDTLYKTIQNILQGLK